MKRALPVLLFLLLIFSYTYAYAENEITEGYDENTEVTVKGTLKEITRGMRGPIIAILLSGSKEYRVVTAPPWYIAREGIDLRKGTSYEVTGSKYISSDGNLYIIASRLKDLSSGKKIQLRDASYIPLWRGHGHMGRGFNSGP